MPKRFITALILLCGCAQQSAKLTIRCDAARRTGLLPPEITEASGVAISRRQPGLLWVHNDNAPIILFGIDSTGTIRSRVHVPGVATADFEDIAVAPCQSGSCLFLGDIGDNLRNRTQHVIYRIPEPALGDTLSAEPVRFMFHLPRPQDTEALFVMPDGHMYVITKGRSGPVTVYEFPYPLTPERDVLLRPVYDLSAGLVQMPDMVTGAGVTPDGRFVIIRSYSEFQLYTLRHDTLKSVLRHPYDLHSLHEPQGEGVDIDDRGTVFLVSEKSLSDSAPPISRVQCHLPS